MLAAAVSAASRSRYTGSGHLCSGLSSRAHFVGLAVLQLVACLVCCLLALSACLAVQPFQVGRLDGSVSLSGRNQDPAGESIYRVALSCLVCCVLCCSICSLVSGCIACCIVVLPCCSCCVRVFCGFLLLLVQRLIVQVTPAPSTCDPASHLLPITKTPQVSRFIGLYCLVLSVVLSVVLPVILYRVVLSIVLLYCLVACCVRVFVVIVLVSCSCLVVLLYCSCCC